MNIIHHTDRRQLAVVVTLIFTLLAALLAGSRLGNAAFWDDEAYVAIVARTLTTTGQYSIWDGRNIYLPRNGIGFTGVLRPTLPPMDVLACAVSVKLFGQSTASARIPFVLFAIATIPFFAALVWRRFPDNIGVLVYSLAALCLSSAFLLNARTCRYYSAAMFFSTVAFWAYDRAAQTRRIRWYAAFGAAVVLLFYTSYLIAAALVGAVAISHVVFQRKSLTQRDWMLFGATGLGIALLTVPYALHYHTTTLTYDGKAAPWLPSHLNLIWWNFRDVNLWCVFPWAVAVALAAIAWRARRSEGDAPLVSAIAWWWLPLLLYVVCIGILSPQPGDETTIADIRYLVPFLPWMAALTGIVLWRLHRISPVLGIIAALLLLCTNLFALVPSSVPGVYSTSQFRPLLPAYIREVTHSYPTGMGAIVSYLAANAKQDDTVAAYPDLARPPIIAYLGDRVKVACQLDRATTEVPESVVRRLGAPLYKDENFPDWVVSMAVSQGAEDAIRYFSREVVVNGKHVRRKYVQAAHFDIFYGQTQRPELPWHFFGPVPRFDPAMQGVTIYRSLSPVEVSSPRPSAPVDPDKTGAKSPRN